MKKLLVMLLTLGAPAAALAESFQNVPLIDQKCQAKDPASHPTSCLIKCAGAGYGIKTGDAWLKLDQAGNQKALAALKSTSKKNDIRVNVSGERKGEMLEVSSLAIAE